MSIAIDQPLEELVKTTVDHQVSHLRQRRTEPIAKRLERLQKLRKWIHENRTAIQQALFSDFNKPVTETDMTEIFPVLSELKTAINELDVWTREKKVSAPIEFIGTRSSIRYEPKGVCLIIAPWNYPFNLAVGPLISALAAGNSVVIKPSEATPHVSSLLRQMMKTLFDASVVTVIEGGPEVAQLLLAQPFDHIFFTGSPAIGKLVMRAAAENLTSVTLELGGKSPAIVTASADLNDTAKRIAFGKFINNGQTCIAPDYVLVDAAIADKFTKRLIEQTKALFIEKGLPLEQSPHYGRIINEKHFDRITALIGDAVNAGATLEWSGTSDRATRFIPPAILTNIPDEARLMTEEIFGPVLPVITFRSIEEAIRTVNEKPKPLALYIFTQTDSVRDKILAETSSGGVCVNDCAIHFLHAGLPFGGVNNSGIGKSHGYSGFLAFSNEKPVLRQRRGITSTTALLPPYTTRVKQIVTWLLRFF